MWSKFADAVAHAAGRPIVFVAGALSIVVWAGFGPPTGYSDTWQLVANTGTTLVTFLMGFLILGTENRNSAATHAKLNALILAIERADNSAIGLERRSEEEIEAARRLCETEAQEPQT